VYFLICPLRNVRMHRDFVLLYFHVRTREPTLCFCFRVSRKRGLRSRALVDGVTDFTEFVGNPSRIRRDTYARQRRYRMTARALSIRDDERLHTRAQRKTATRAVWIRATSSAVDMTNAPRVTSPGVGNRFSHSFVREFFRFRLNSSMIYERFSRAWDRLK